MITNNAARGRAYVFTSYALEFKPETIQCQYLIYQTEECPTTKKRHNQGFIYFKNPILLTNVIKKLNKAHIEPCIDIQASIKYCSKEETRIEGPFEFGERPAQGKRSDLDSLVEDMKSGKSLIELDEIHRPTIARHLKYYDRLNKILNKPKDFLKPEVYFFWGDTGTGKTRAAIEMLGDKNYYTKNGCGKWWEGYDGEKYLLIDEFKDNLDRDQMLGLLGGWGTRLEYKGGSCYCQPELVIFTSNHDPNKLYKGDPGWLRRLTHIKKFDANSM